MILNISQRNSIPATQLFINIVTKDNQQLGNRPIVFFLPGGPGADSSLYQSYNCLLDVADIVYHDPRECGLSDKSNPEHFTMDVYIDDIEEIRKHLGIENIIVNGKSYGSSCAMGYALRYPQAVTKLVLAAGSTSYRFMELAKRNLMLRGNEQQKLICEKLWKGEFKSYQDVKEYFTIMASLYSNKAKNDPSIYKLGQSPEKYSYEALNLGFKTFLRTFDFDDQLINIKCPTLILAGQDDWVNDVSIAKSMSQKIPQNKLVIFENSGHSMETDVPEQFFEEIRKFIVTI